MGKRYSKINPTIAGRVNKNLLKRSIPLIKDTVESLPMPWEIKKRGKKPYPPKMVVCLLILGAMLSLTYEGMESVLNTNALVMEHFKGPRKRLPSKSTYHRGAQRLSLNYLTRLNKALVKNCILGQQIVLHVDSTGFRLKNSSSWFDIRIKRKSRRKDHLKLHALVVHKLGLIYSFAITKAYTHDSPIFLRLMREISLKKFLICGDAGYLSRINCNITRGKKGFAVFKIKKGTTAKKRGSKAWHEMVNLYEVMRWGYNILYHLRSYVEATFGAVKQRFDHEVHAHIWYMQRREIAMKVISHNVKQLLYIQEAEDCNLPLWVSDKPEMVKAKNHVIESLMNYALAKV